MEDLLSKIYHSIICNESDSIEMAEKYEEQIEVIIESLKERLSEEDLELVKECMYEVSFLTEKGGFVMGARFMAKFMDEVMGKER